MNCIFKKRKKWLFCPLPTTTTTSTALAAPRSLRTVRLAQLSPTVTMREITDRLCLEVEGKVVSRTEGTINDLLIGGNASAEGPEGEGMESPAVTSVDIVGNHHFRESSFTEEAYKRYIKDYMKSLKGKLEGQKPEKVKPFMTGAAEQIKHLLANFNNYQFLLVKT